MDRRKAWRGSWWIEGPSRRGRALHIEVIPRDIGYKQLIMWPIGDRRQLWSALGRCWLWLIQIDVNADARFKLARAEVSGAALIDSARTVLLSAWTVRSTYE